MGVAAVQEVRMKPIIFNTEMVRAILEGRKTVTRRVVKPQHKDACGFYVTTRKSDGAFMGVYDYDENEKMFESSQTPPACVGDVLYVRETYMEAGCKLCEVHECYGGADCAKYWYKADMSESDLDEIKEDKLKWRPSIHMPKAVARIFLRVKSVRVERLQDMELDDFITEGISGVNELDYKYDFINLWNSTIKPDQLKYYSWESNPYVWVIEFERISREEAYSNGIE